MQLPERRSDDGNFNFEGLVDKAQAGGADAGTIGVNSGALCGAVGRC